MLKLKKTVLVIYFAPFLLTQTNALVMSLQMQP